MLSEISWQSYWIAIAVTLAVYYPIIIFIFYRGQIQFFTKRVISPEMPNRSYELFGGYGETSHTDSGFEELAADLQVFFENLEPDEFSREEFIETIGRILTKHPLPKRSTNCHVVIKYITEQTKHFGPLRLHEDEVKALW